MSDEKRIKLYGIVEMRLALYLKIQVTLIVTLAVGSVWAFVISHGPGTIRNLSYIFAVIAFLEALETVYYLKKK